MIEKRGFVKSIFCVLIISLFLVSFVAAASDNSNNKNFFEKFVGFFKNFFSLTQNPTGAAVVGGCPFTSECPALTSPRGLPFTTSNAAGCTYSNGIITDNCLAIQLDINNRWDFRNDSNNNCAKCFSDGTLCDSMKIGGVQSLPFIMPDGYDCPLPGFLAVCGNGILEFPEECDDSNLINGDGCSGICESEEAIAACGNGILEFPEECDDSNLINGDGCSGICESEEAIADNVDIVIVDNGDGTFNYAVVDQTRGVNLVEINDNVGLIDLGMFNFNFEITNKRVGISLNNVSLVGTTKAVTLPFRDKICAVDNNIFIAGTLKDFDCWNNPARITWEGGNKCSDTLRVGKDASGTSQPQYTCQKMDIGGDDYAKVIGFSYTTVIADESCGDGTVDSGEECDDGNIVSGDGCSSVCLNEAPTSVCGNGVIESGEQCDDGNANNGDGCSVTCVVDCDDSDGDGYGQNGYTSCPNVGVDCNDGNSQVYPGANDATCNGIDDDCDGLIDEDYLETVTSCGIGACGSTGLLQCISGSVVDSCSAGTPAATDTNCDGIDNNCNGQVDEAYVSLPTTCGIGACQSGGTTSCVLGIETDSCTAGTPGANDLTCNGIDDNCDGSIDEAYVSLPTTCGIGECAATGATSCVSGLQQDSCTAGTPSIELCDGLDNNCDGSILDDGTDEAWYGDITTCGITECQNEVWWNPSVDCSDDSVNFCQNTNTLICQGGVQTNNCVANPKQLVFGDGDNDLFGSASDTLSVCSIPSGYITPNQDCNDFDSGVNPLASDVCDINNNVVNKDCNATNDNEIDCGTYCGDNDGDSYVPSFVYDNYNLLQRVVCVLKVTGDCDDANVNINPAGIEICDGLDNNCDGNVDEGCPGVDKETALVTLESLTASNLKDQKDLDKAIKELKNSLGNRNVDGDKHIIWIDSEHIECKDGYKVFDKEKKAAYTLGKLDDAVIQSSVNSVINSLVEIDRSLAQIAIDEAVAGKDKDKAIEKFNKGDSETDPKKKIQEYRQAWKYVNKKCDKVPSKKSCIDEITVMSPVGDLVSAIGFEVGNPNTVFEDVEENQVSIHTSCSKCIEVGQVINGWTITEIVEDGILAAKCSKK